MIHELPETDSADLRGLALFAGLNDNVFGALTAGAFVQSFAAGELLHREGAPADFLHIIVDGQVELFSTWDGRETMMAAVRPVATFILADTIRNEPYLFSARTIKPSRIVLLRSENVRGAFADSAAFARAAATELSRCYLAVARAQMNLKLRSSAERLANFLLSQHARLGEPDSFVLAVEKRKLASQLGMSPENLSRAFRSLQDHGVRVEGARIALRDRAGLSAFAKPHPLIDEVSG